MIAIKHLLLICSLFLTSYVKANEQMESSILGDWLNHRGTGIIKISKQGGVYSGKIIGGGKGKARKDIHNPDPKLRDRPLKGLEILGDLKFHDDQNWQDGWLYDPLNGETYSCNINMSEQDKLDIRVYKGSPLFGKTITWTRIGKAGIKPD